MKKQIISLALGAFMVTSMSLTAFAANPTPTDSASSQKAATYPSCTVDNCNATKTHQHKNKSYAGHTMNDGHSYHQVCTKTNCTQTGTHDHDGTTYFEHHSKDGHNYHTGKNQHKGNNGHNNRHNKSGGHHS